MKVKLAGSMAAMVWLPVVSCATPLMMLWVDSQSFLHKISSSSLLAFVGPQARCIPPAHRTVYPYSIRERRVGWVMTPEKKAGHRQG
ncbi:MAG: hypothetical protein IJH86_07550 [Clostridia bacterium]|nr:hypothetical protein [Clostridia bacterium]